MSHYEELPQKLWKYCDLPVKCVNNAVWTRMCLYLNPEKSSFGKKFGYLQDWRGVAECMGHDNLHITNFQLSENPMEKVIENISETFTIGYVLLAILRCERYDLLEDVLLLHHLEKCSKYNLPKPMPHDEPPLVDSTDKGDDYYDRIPDMYYHALVCYSRTDLSFVKVLITELENKNHLKLCIQDRDFDAGGSFFEDMTKMINKKCRKVILILSPEFLESEECAFILNFSLSIDPSAKHKKIIPIIYKKCQVPDSMATIASVDFSRQDVIQWFWKRLKAALLLENDVSSNPSVSEEKLTSIAEAESTVTSSSSTKGFLRFVFKRWHASEK